MSWIAPCPGRSDSDLHIRLDLRERGRGTRVFHPTGEAAPRDTSNLQPLRERTPGLERAKIGTLVDRALPVFPLKNRERFEERA